MAKIFYLQIVFVVITVMVSGQGDVPRRCDYGDHCGFVPAPPGRTPACAAPGLTYCEQLDHYPKDLIRELVDKKQFDLSSLLSDETRDDFGATVNKHGPYGYGPNSLRGTHHISLVNPQPHGQGFQASIGPNFPNSGYLPPENDPFLNRGQFQNQYYRGNSIPPPNGYVGYYTPSDQQRPPPQTNFPPSNSYLPSKPTNVSFDGGWNRGQFRPIFPSPINLGNEEFWRGNPYFEVPKPFDDFTRNNIGQHGQYSDNNGARYYSNGRAQAGTYSSARGGLTPIHEKDFHSGSAHHAHQRRAAHHSSIRPERFPRLPQNRRTDDQDTSTADNDINSKTVSKRSFEPNLKNIFKILSDNKEDELHLGTNHTTLSRSKRQTLRPGVEQLCPTRSQYIMPRAALNKQGNWMYVVNMGDTDGNSQLVRTEICDSEECNGICSLPLGYNSRCEQRHVQKRLVALDQNGKNLYTDVFWFPSCCLCTISSNQT